MLRLLLFGGFELQQASGAAIPVRARKVRALLAYLALSAGHAHTRERLADLLWETGDTRTSLRQALTTIRKSLPDNDLPPLVAEADAIALNPAAFSVDTDDFERLVRSGTPDALERAADLYRGDLLGNFSTGTHGFDDWLTAERMRFRDLAIDAFDALVAYYVDEGADDKAIRTANRILAIDPLREGIHRTLMRLYVKQRQPNAALRQYRDCRDTLERELAVPPEPETHRLYREILESRGRDDSGVTNEASPVSTRPADSIAAIGTTPSPTERDTPRSPAPASRELRQAAVVFADLSRFTQLSDELDFEELDALLDAYFAVVDRIIEEHGGTIDKHLGDGVMAVFGVPTARSNDAERAVRAGIAIQQAMPDISREVGRELHTHIGIASGQVLVDAGSLRGTVTGNCVNTASRLSDVAQPGEIIVGSSLRRALADRLDAEEARDLDLKDVGHRTKPWRVKGFRTYGAHANTPFVGRRTELIQIDGVIRSCRDTSRGMTVYVRGEAGIGKTRLIERFATTAEREGFVCHRGVVLDFGTGRGDDPIRAIVRSILRIDSDDAGVLATAAERAIDDGLVDPERRASLNDLLELPQPAELEAIYGAMDQATRVRLVRDTVANLIERTSRETPVLAVIEDIHWADPVILEFLAGLTATVGDCAALLVMSARTESDPIDRAWRTSTEGGPFMTIDLAPLRNTEAIDLARAMGTENEDLATACIERSGGNPLFLEQLLRSAEDLGRDVVPGTVRSLVLARLDGLAALDKRAVEAAAIMGQRFTLASLRHLLSDPSYVCDNLCQEVFLKPDGDDLMFAHALVRDAIYTSLLKSERADLHRRAAEWFQSTDLLLHAEHLDRAGAPHAAAAYLAAAQAEAQRFHFAQVSRLAARGREIAETDAERFELACFHGEALRKVAQMDDAIEAFRTAIESAPSDANAYRARIGLAEALSISDRYDDALSELDAAQRVAEAVDDDGAIAEIRSLRGNIYFPIGRMDECLAEHEAALSMARRANSKLAEAKALSGLGDAFYQRGRMRTAQKYFDACVRLAHENDFLQIEAVNLAMLGITYIYVNQLGTGQRYCAAGVELAEKISDLRAELIARLVLGDIAWYAGELDETRRQGEIGLELSRRLRSLRFEGEILAYLGRVAWKDGRRDEATQLFDDGLKLSREAGMHYAGAEVLAGIARFTEDPERRRAALEEGSALLASGTCVSHGYFHYYQFAIEIMLEEGNWDGAIDYGKQLAAYTEAEPLPWADYFINRGNALAAWGRGDHSPEAAEEIRRMQRIGEDAGIRMTYPDLNNN